MENTIGNIQYILHAAVCRIGACASPMSDDYLNEFMYCSIIIQHVPISCRTSFLHTLRAYVSCQCMYMYLTLQSLTAVMD
jgi:hypothetical protein